MRLALLSDIHGNLAALEAVCADLSRRGADRVACLGDNLSGPLLPRETAQFLMATDWTILAGNHERQVLDFERLGGGASDGFARAQLGPGELAWLRGLQHCLTLDQGIVLCHGSPRSDCEHMLETIGGGRLHLAHASDISTRLGATDAALVACGHSHVPRALRQPAGRMLINPGSVGLQAYLDDHPEPYAMELGTPDAQYAIAERGAAGWRVEHYAVPYDHEAMARLAARRGREDWRQALLTGYVR